VVAAAKALAKKSSCCLNFIFLKFLCLFACVRLTLSLTLYPSVDSFLPLFSSSHPGSSSRRRIPAEEEKEKNKRIDGSDENDD